MTKMIRRGQYTRNVSEEIAPPIKENTRGKKNSATILYCIQLRYCVKRHNERTLIATFCKIHWHPSPLFLNSILLQAMTYLNSKFKKAKEKTT